MPVRGHGYVGFEPTESRVNHRSICLPAPSPISYACQLGVAPHILDCLPQFIIVSYESVKVFALPESSGAIENFIRFFCRE